MQAAVADGRRGRVGPGQVPGHPGVAEAKQIKGAGAGAGKGGGAIGGQPDPVDLRIGIVVRQEGSRPRLIQRRGRPRKARRRHQGDDHEDCDAGEGKLAQKGGNRNDALLWRPRVRQGDGSVKPDPAEA